MPKLGYKGKDQGNMSPVVDSYQKPDSTFAGMQMGKTDEYISRHNAFEGKESSMVKKQDYKGRYS